MDYFDSSKTILELLYLLSSPLLVLMGLIGLYQIKIAKKTLVVNSERQAAELAAKQIEYYLHQIIPLQNQFIKIEREHKIEKLKLDTSVFTHQGLVAQMGKEEIQKIWDERYPHVLQAMLDVANSMEAFSTYFTKGIADEEIAFSAVGETFCFYVKEIYFILAYQRKENNKYSNILQLYEIWNTRLKKTSLNRQKEAILKDMNSLKEERIKPVGTY